MRDKDQKAANDFIARKDAKTAKKLHAIRTKQDKALDRLAERSSRQAEKEVKYLRERFNELPTLRNKAENARADVRNIKTDNTINLAANVIRNSHLDPAVMDHQLLTSGLYYARSIKAEHNYNAALKHIDKHVKKLSKTGYKF